MNGWQRLFLVACVAWALFIAGFVWTEYNKFANFHIGYVCEYPDRATEGFARAVLASGNYKQHEWASRPNECRDKLQDIASGKDGAALRKEFLSEAWWLPVFFIVPASLLYGIGLVIGWVWRGFFPKKKAKD